MGRGAAAPSTRWWPADHVDMYWFPHTDRVRSSGTSASTPTSPGPAAVALPLLLDDDLLPNTVFGALTAAGNRVPRSIPRLNRLAPARSPTAPTATRPPGLHVAAPRRLPRDGVRRAAGGRARGAARGAAGGRRPDWRISFPVEIRVAPADDMALSTAYGRDSIYLAFHTHRTPTEHHARTSPRWRRVLRAHDGRPHWGKLHTRTAADLAPASPRFGDFARAARPARPRPGVRQPLPASGAGRLIDP